LQNAIKYSPEGGRIAVGLRREGNQAIVTVSDSGIGIPEKDVPEIFTRFFRAMNVDPRQISGLGVGLYIVKEIVIRHGGTIEVESREGEGTTFTVCLPMVPGSV
jgi:signal transduction histidine kinase